MVGRGEVNAASWPSPRQLRIYHPADLHALKRDAYVEIPGDYDLFGDGTVVVLSTPGHTPGELSLVVRLATSTYVLTGDAVHDRRQLQTLTPLPGDFDADQAVNSLKRVRLLSKTHQARIWTGHDPDDWAEYARPNAWIS